MTRKSTFIVVMVVGIFMICTAIGWASDSKGKSIAQTKPLVLGYYTDASPAAFNKYHSYMNQMSTDTLNTDGSGNLIGSVPKQAVQQANKWKIDTFALVSNYGETDWDPEAAHDVITDPIAKKKLIAGLLQTVKQNQYRGVNLDFESLVPADRQALSTFVRDTAKVMKANGFQTMVSVPAKQKDDPKDGWSGAYDYKAIGSAADWLQVMTYDEHGVWSEPGSSAGKEWIQSSLAFAVKQVPSNKVLMGLPAYGNDWNVTQTTQEHDDQNVMLSWKDTPALLAKYHLTGKRDNVSGSMTARYTDSQGDQHEVWYEDATSIEQKAKLSQQYNLAGVSMYAIGMEDQQFWQAVQKGVSATK